MKCYFPIVSQRLCPTVNHKDAHTCTMPDFVRLQQAVLSLLRLCVCMCVKLFLQLSAEERDKECDVTVCRSFVFMEFRPQNVHVLLAGSYTALPQKYPNWTITLKNKRIQAEGCRVSADTDTSDSSVMIYRDYSYMSAHQGSATFIIQRADLSGAAAIKFYLFLRDFFFFYGFGIHKNLEEKATGCKRRL